MTHSDDEQRSVRIAQGVLRWYQNPSDEDDVVQNVISAEDAAAQFPSSAAPFSILFKRTFRNENFAKERKTLLSRWGEPSKHVENLSINEAKAILRDWISLLDHRILFDHSILTGKTHAKRSDPDTDFPVSYHSNRSAWTLHLTVKGAVEYQAGTTVEASRGSLLLISPEASAHYQRKHDEDEWCHYWVVFPSQAGWKELMQWPMCSYGMYMVSLEEEQTCEFEDIFEQIMSLGNASEPLTDRLRNNLVEQLLIRGQKFIEPTGNGATDARVIEASNYMMEHLDRSQSVADIASHCNISESRLSHLFQQHVGMGIQKYRNSLRLQRAKRLLATSNSQVGEIARKVGFENPAEFSRFFSKNIGCSPRQFRATFLKTGSESPI
jgi:AraC-like DNA-binding protein